MLSRYQALARRLAPYRRVLLLAAILMALNFIWQVTFVAASSHYLLPTLLTTLLLLCFILLVQFFGKAQPLAKQRWRRWLNLVWLHSLALLLTLILCGWLFLFVKTVATILRQHVL